MSDRQQNAYKQSDSSKRSAPKTSRFLYGRTSIYRWLLIHRNLLRLLKQNFK
ncbi:hypothetical protein S7335_4145 [Synechococcus sp. PCC 7335]|nr:hypothetical protein S7335_4145 [Synechococcus sp. PCC 7335]